MTSLTPGSGALPALLTPLRLRGVTLPDHSARDLTGSHDTYPVQAGPRLGRREFLGRLDPWTGPEPVQVAGRS
ncbi:hypothetical protein SAMN05660657_01986 [Geodermatophilus amargosae]|uniref:Uncharacterized protein n=1 Tax=Geodermatophilus amargosae TaxID=1296565 RepID=A0A1I6ZIB0_9ACTN|nr:hypothetical protein [Geodermatophilus amargosae]SFT62434.1 hypothetical protein SAMN05660657_01986 [Geodermatophilus amargosae]